MVTNIETRDGINLSYDARQEDRKPLLASIANNSACGTKTTVKRGGNEEPLKIVQQLRFITKHGEVF